MLHAHIFNGGFRYLAAQSEADHYLRELKREQEEIVAVPDIGMIFFTNTSSDIK